MALSNTRMGDAIKAAIDAVGDKTDRTLLFRAMAQAIIDEFKNNGIINIPVLTVTSVSGVTTGGGTSGPGTTAVNTGTIT